MTDAHARALGGIGSFGELVNSGVKTLALSAVLPAAEMDQLFPEAERVAERNKVQLYRESDLLVTDLFPADVATGKDVLLIYQGSTKDAYLQLKADADSLRKAGLYEGKAREAIARRFGRMLSYPTWRINELLAEQGEFRTLRDFGIRASNLFLYYRDLDRATEFYRGTLGMELVADYDMARIFRMTEDSYLILVDATKGMHTADEPKSIAVALVTDQLEQWHAYLEPLAGNIVNGVDGASWWNVAQNVAAGFGALYDAPDKVSVESYAALTAARLALYRLDLPNAIRFANESNLAPKTAT